MKYAVLKFFSCRPVCSAIVNFCRAIGSEYDSWVNRAARGFPGDSFFQQIRRQPSSPLLAVLERRLCRFDARRARRHNEKGRELTELLEKSVACPGTSVSPNTYWVFPVLVDEPTRLLEHLVRHGFDATQGQSLCVVAPPEDRVNQKATAAQEILAKLVFLPFYPELPIREARRMAKVVLDYLATSSTPSPRSSAHKATGEESRKGVRNE